MATYEFTDQTMRFKGRVLHRIVSSRGDIGGWLQSRNNLCNDPDDTSWVADDAKVLGSAYVGENGYVNCAAVVHERARVLGGTVTDSARVGGFAHIRDNAVVCDTSMVVGAKTVINVGLRIKGDALITRTPVSARRSDNYLFVGYFTRDGTFLISAGCRLFTLREARNHWKFGPRGGTRLGGESLCIVNMLHRAARLAR